MKLARENRQKSQVFSTVSLKTKGPNRWHQIEESLWDLRQVTQPLCFLAVNDAVGSPWD